MKLYIDGQIKENQTPEIFEPGFLFGWGVFEPLRIYKGKIPFLERHTKRLNESLELLGIEKINLDWESIIKELLGENNLDAAYARIAAYKKRKGTGVIIYAANFTYYTPETYEKGFKAIISTIRRDKEDITSKVKSFSYLNNRLSWLQAQKKGVDEALILNKQGCLAGGARSNLFLVSDGKILIPSLESGAFCGITREIVILIAKDLNIPLEEKEVTLDDIDKASEAFITSALMEVMPLVEITQKKISTGLPGEITLKILSEYRKRLS